MERIIISIMKIINPELEDVPNELKKKLKKKLHSEAKQVRLPKDSDEPEERYRIEENIHHKKKLLGILRNGVNFFGINLDIPGLNMTGKKEASRRN
jgi:hypothetical protein